MRTALRLLRRAGVTPVFPLTLRSLETLFGVLKAARYRSAAGYVASLRVEAFLKGYPADPELGEWCRRLARATARIVLWPCSLCPSGGSYRAWHAMQTPGQPLCDWRIINSSYAV